MHVFIVQGQSCRLLLYQILTSEHQKKTLHLLQWQLNCTSFFSVCLKSQGTCQELKVVKICFSVFQSTSTHFSPLFNVLSVIVFVDKTAAVSFKEYRYIDIRNFGLLLIFICSSTVIYSFHFSWCRLHYACIYLLMIVKFLSSLCLLTTPVSVCIPCILYCFFSQLVLFLFIANIKYL